jgi:hypothetical protein
MRTSLRTTLLCACMAGALASLLAPAAAQRPRRSVEAQATLPAVDPASIAALTRMGDALRGLRSFEIDARTLVEAVLDNDQKIGIAGTARYRARLPDRLRVNLSAGPHQREIVYDGRTLTVAAPRERYYAEVPAKPTIKATLEDAAQRLGIDMPLADLFAWGTSDGQWNSIRESFRVGEITIGGVPCEHWVFRERHQDWELCIRTVDAPLPIRLAITNRQDPALPRFEAILNWTVNEPFADDVFAYTPGPETTRIEFLTPEMAGVRQ